MIYLRINSVNDFEFWYLCQRIHGIKNQNISNLLDSPQCMNGSHKAQPCTCRRSGSSYGQELSVAALSAPTPRWSRSSPPEHLEAGPVENCWWCQSGRARCARCGMLHWTHSFSWACPVGSVRRLAGIQCCNSFITIINYCTSNKIYPAIFLCYPTKQSSKYKSKKEVWPKCTFLNLTINSKKSLICLFMSVLYFWFWNSKSWISQPQY